jgi:hypothetical protein
LVVLIADKSTFVGFVNGRYPWLLGRFSRQPPSQGLLLYIAAAKYMISLWIFSVQACRISLHSCLLNWKLKKGKAQKREGWDGSIDLQLNPTNWYHAGSGVQNVQPPGVGGPVLWGNIQWCFCCWWSTHCRPQASESL